MIISDLNYIETANTVEVEGGASAYSGAYASNFIGAAAASTNNTAVNIGWFYRAANSSSSSIAVGVGNSASAYGGAYA